MINHIHEILPYIDALPNRKTRRTDLLIFKPPASNFSLLKQFTLTTGDELSILLGKVFRGAADTLVEAGVTIEVVKLRVRHGDIFGRLVALGWIAPSVGEPNVA
jgi:hypothetical protein